jgi:hypothetical protein
MKFISVVFSVTLVLLCAEISVAGGQTADVQLPPLETVVIEPVGMDNVSIWVPAAKSGPFINRSCRAKENCAYSLVLPASVKHTKTDCCPVELARLLAEKIAPYHQESLPLTIFNGWQWEYSYSLCQFDSITYDLAQRGGSWENSWEAILTLSCATDGLGWVEIASAPKIQNMQVHNAAQSAIEVITFSGMRTRDGYPKERQL